MRTISFNTEDEWLAWRKTGLGGSDAPIIAGVSRFKRPFDLFLEKTGKRKATSTNKAMRHGNENEAKARDAYSLETGFFMPPVNVESEDIPWLHASLDGYDSAAGIVLEVKCPYDIGPYLAAREGEIHEEYFPQVQHCLAVSGASQAHLWVFFDGVGVLLKVEHDPAYWCDELLPLEKEFWKYVQNKDYPLPKGEENKETDPQWLSVEDEVYQAMGMREVAENRLRTARAKMERMAVAGKTRGKLIEAIWEYRKGGFVPGHQRSESLTLSFRRIK